ncbi:MAG: hypothetical protein CM15mP74_14630 [Halieaceae bacterium]|nr:MAG: hypothetical protein CM15mP74_14630 [Halieaceae bacterium]
MLFGEFAFTLGGPCGISGFVAMTLSPIMSAWVCPGPRSRDANEPLGQ